MNKRGQGLPLNTIIIAIIVLVVLVVLIAIFVQRLGDTQTDLDREGDLEIVRLKSSYGSCRPSASAEISFTENYNSATQEATTLAQKRSNLRISYANLIGECKKRTENCEDTVLGLSSNPGLLTVLECSR